MIRRPSTSTSRASKPLLGRTPAPGAPGRSGTKTAGRGNARRSTPSGVLSKIPGMDFRQVSPSDAQINRPERRSTRRASPSMMAGRTTSGAVAVARNRQRRSPTEKRCRARSKISSASSARAGPYFSSRSSTINTKRSQPSGDIASTAATSDSPPAGMRSGPSSARKTRSSRNWSPPTARGSATAGIAHPPRPGSRAISISQFRAGIRLFFIGARTAVRSRRGRAIPRSAGHDCTGRNVA
mgnify:CR=1 FL=1